MVNPVNCVGVMGKGLALAFKRAFPGLCEAYAQACNEGAVAPGVIWTWVPPAGGPRLLHLATKRHWSEPSCIEDIRDGLHALVQQVHEQGIGSIAVPALGCGAGGLSWDVVRPEIETILGPLQGVDVWLFPPK